MIEILFPAFLLSVVLVGIHAYFGLEIIRRGIIFTDLAIGQMAALGAAISLLFLDGKCLYAISLVCSLSGGILIAFVSRKQDNPEPFIGLLYAFGISGVFISLSKSPHGMEEFQNLMAANILFTPLDEIIKVSFIYLALGIFIYFANKRTSGFLKDVFFFITFSVAITHSVKIAGVLVVFALLIGPAMISLKINKGNLLINAWIVGVITNLTGIVISYYFDFPTGYTIIFINSLAAMLFSLGSVIFPLSYLPQKTKNTP